jgi:hypothetical protein
MQPDHKDTIAKLMASKLHDSEWSWLLNALTNRSSGDRNSCVAGVVEALSVFSNFEIPATMFIPAFRRTDKESTADDDHSGRGLLKKLEYLQSPKHHDIKSRERWRAINRFVKYVTGNESSSLQVVTGGEELNVEMDGKILPLASLGSGIHEVVVLAAAATVASKQIVCVEEPELHLHPILQRKLCEYFMRETDNQYFISTHSAHLIDVPDSAIFHVQLTSEGTTAVRRVTMSSEKWEVCHELGYRPSDIMLANCIVWVEGPSDRLYVSWWIDRASNSELVEGLHYSIMFYGGRLLSHLTAEDPEVTDFISLCALNRNIAMLMDSDKEEESAELGKTKRRVRDEVDAKGGFVWVTDGREVENYLPHEAVVAAVGEVSPDRAQYAIDDKWSHVLPRRSEAKGADFVDKVKVAHHVTQGEPSFNRYDLKKQIDRLVEFILQANHQERVTAKGTIDSK